MFFKFGLNLINVVLRYQSRLGDTIFANGVYTLATLPVSRVQGMTILLFTVAMATALVALMPFLHQTENYISLLNMLVRLDHYFGPIFAGYSMRRSIVGLRFCYISAIIFGIVRSNCVNLLTVFATNFPPFLESVIVRHVITGYYVDVIFYVLVFSIQPWAIMAITSWQ
ncbi:hypothetical protein Fcan01_00487 [Folsomia candida]|uniref:Uncharacterized protein n=1 Tax=Folsomia candida TaxID=158441 RepID=A0A226EZQ4_FOLCA|nr:hypothetical protein Fcan01_00487 [Folsomia candida]